MERKLYEMEQNFTTLLYYEMERKLYEMERNFTQFTTFQRKACSLN